MKKAADAGRKSGREPGPDVLAGIIEDVRLLKEQVRGLLLREAEREGTAAGPVSRKEPDDRDWHLFSFEDAAFFPFSGQLEEWLYRKGVEKLFAPLGFDFTMMQGSTERQGPCGMERLLGITAYTEDTIMAVEVMNPMGRERVMGFVKTLERVWDCLPKFYRGRRVVGTVAYIDERDGAASLAQEQGLFVIRAADDAASIINGSGFRPRKF